MTQHQPGTLSRSTRIITIVLAVIAPVVVAIMWSAQLDANFNHTFEGLSFSAYIPIVMVTSVVGLAVPAIVAVYALVVRARSRGGWVPYLGIVVGGLSLLVALPMLFDAVPLVTYEINLGHAPTAQESLVSSASLLTKATAFEDQTAAQIGAQIIRRDEATSFVCDLSNGHLGHGYSVAVRMTAPPTPEAISGVLDYWKSLGYSVRQEGFRYSAIPVHQLAPALVATREDFEITVTTSCATH